MAFHEHCFGESGLVLEKCQLDCHDGLRQCKDFINAHIDCGQLQQSLQFLVNFQCNKAYADMGLYPFSGKVKHRSDLNLGFCYPEGFLHVP